MKRTKFDIILAICTLIAGIINIIFFIKNPGDASSTTRLIAGGIFYPLLLILSIRLLILTKQSKK